MCSRYLSVRFPLVWSIYALLYAFHISLYKPLLSWSCVVLWVLGLVSSCSVFVLLKAIFMSVCLKMGSPISSTVAEVFLRDVQNTHLKQILDAQNITFYARYVDDILLIYNTKHTTLEIIHSHINKVHPNLQFTPTFQHNNRISFLDLLIIRHPTQIETDIFRKTTTTDSTINYTSNHPTEHKMAAYRHLINRMLSLPLSTERRIAECQKIRTIANNNKFSLHHIAKLRAQIQRYTQMNTANNGNNNKWATFTYHSSKVRK